MMNYFKLSPKWVLIETIADIINPNWKETI